MKIYWAFPEERWNQNPIPEPGDLDPNRAFLPLYLARKGLTRLGHEVLPFNELEKNPSEKLGGVLFSFDGMHKLSRNIRRTHGIEKIVHFFMEAPMVGMRYYTQRYQQRVFDMADSVYVQHRSYISSCFRNSSRLKEFRYAHGHLGIDETLFETEKRKQLVAICANKGIGIKQSLKRTLLGINPFSYHSAWLLKERNKCLHDLAGKGRIDVYGFGWNRIALDLSHFSYPLENNSWKGHIDGPKFDNLSQYEFCLCYENSCFPGYITEKIFDCFVSGSIPVYRGAPDIDVFIPGDLHIDLADFASADDLLDHLDSMSDARKADYRRQMKQYMTDEKNDLFSPVKFSDLIIRAVDK